MSRTHLPRDVTNALRAEAAQRRLDAQDGAATRQKLIADVLRAAHNWDLDQTGRSLADLEDALGAWRKAGSPGIDA